MWMVGLALTMMWRKLTGYVDGGTVTAGYGFGTTGERDRH